MYDKKKELLISSDHGGYELKQFLINKLKEAGIKIKDFGTHSEDSVDYPDFIHPVAKIVNEGDNETAVIICGSGNGAQMTANKYDNVRAALCWNSEQAELTRRHNDANILSLPGRFIDFDEAWKAVQNFLNTDFEGGRHIRRVEKISERK
jgi:ribose 5-phosphate isomerase B